ncbi:PssD/Cps14F family polysaccharide biosynthesis glycosyltransferase [Photobacterium leiognathi]|uniref:PssD/Cps14F family polysaccharide biosynthesis glycosyltransferase n=1 Tax=Photobacterium leiognathi TaxID=553611 RepID=UPI002980CEBC|nr:PssD/Cps14F family polysaccharide biosynthesis glycosyltransferase [Photobacterium leiognathi]
MNKPSILFTYGEGGHSAQMNRLVTKLKCNLENFEIISLSDLKKTPNWSSHHYVTGEARGKYTNFQLLTNLGPFKIFKSVFFINKKYNIKAMVSTGPGISVIAALFFKSIGVKIIHVETWSRFTTRSLTGRIMYLLADRFYVQHESLLKVYPNAIYAGVL